MTTRTTVGTARTTYRHGSAAFTSGSPPKAHFQGDRLLTGLSTSLKREQRRDEVAADGGGDPDREDQGGSRQPAGDRQGQCAEQQREQPAEHDRRDDPNRVDLQPHHGIADELDDDDRPRQAASQTTSAIVRPRNTARRVTGWLMYVSIRPASSSAAVRPFAAATAAMAEEQRHDELVQVSPKEPGGCPESGQPERLDDARRQLVDRLADARMIRGTPARRRPSPRRETRARSPSREGTAASGGSGPSSEFDHRPRSRRGHHTDRGRRPRGSVPP